MKVVVEADIDNLVEAIAGNACSLSHHQVKKLWTALSGYVAMDDLRTVLASRLLNEREPTKRLNIHPRFTQAETKVFRLLCDGLPNPEIAKQMGSTVRTIESHVRNILRKTHMKARSEVVAWALREGIA